ncbi:MAG: DNA primase [Candidatus Magasanikbacteria bacterium]|nr:DNA primase [Candidatus Magasanikbacteria bacterium]
MSKVTEEIKSRLDIVSIISEYVQLKPAGVNSKGRCPFHNEKTPSFMVNRERQFWHCFGCNTGGDVFEFLMKIENLEFVEALKILADKTGVKLEDNERIETNKNEKNRLLDIVRLAAKFYHKVLLDSPQSVAARAYVLEERALTLHTLDEWQIGYIPENWDTLTQFLLKKGFGINDMVHAGLVLQKQGGGWYDRFRGRIMFPLSDAQGNVVGFTGRLLKDDPTGQQGKYVNSPQTPLYDKSKLLYGLHYAKRAIKEKGFVVVVEGQMDVIACHEYGMCNVVASSGTALTHEQVRLLKRFTSHIYLAFDADAAGQLAARRGIDIALAEGMVVRIITIPQQIAKDPDECIRKAPDAWSRAVETARHLMEYYFDIFTLGVDLNDAQARTNTAKQLIGEIIKLPDPIDREYWLDKLAHLLGVSVMVLKEQLKVELSRKKPQSASQKSAQISSQFTPQEEPAHKISRQILAWCLKYPSLWTEVLVSIKMNALPTVALKNIFLAAQVSHDKIGEQCKDAKEESHEMALAELLSNDLFDGADEDMNEADEPRNSAQELVTRLNMWYTAKKRQELARTMEEAERAGDVPRMQLIAEELNKLLEH